MNTIVIAEIGENHYGRWDLCRGMVEQVVVSGTTYATFQTYTANQFSTDHTRYEEFKGVSIPEDGNRDAESLQATRHRIPRPDLHPAADALPRGSNRVGHAQAGLQPRNRS